MRRRHEKAAVRKKGRGFKEEVEKIPQVVQKEERGVEGRGDLKSEGKATREQLRYVRVKEGKL